ncbi:MAG: N-glycosylase/DNA lyase [bacterium]
MKEIIDIYARIKPEIESRMKEFEITGRDMPKDELFYELGFCILTPQSKAISCWEAICSIKKSKRKDHKSFEIVKHLNKVRFKNNKSKYFEEAQKMWNDGLLKEMLKVKEPKEMREYLVKNIKGIGFKEASHFLRNIGYGEKLAILDRHILKNLKLLGIIKEVPKVITKKLYLAIEEKMVSFSGKINIPMSHLDFVLWYKEAGRVFK